MRSSISVTAAGLSIVTALLVPLAGEAQGPAVGSLSLLDPAGDLRDVATGEPLEGPAYIDLTGLDVSTDGGQLTVRFDVAEPVPEAPDPLFTTVDYVLNIDTDGDGFQNYHLQIGSEGGWRATLFDYDTVFETELGEATVTGQSLVAMVLLSELGFPPAMRFQGLMSAVDFADPVGDPFSFIEWEDRAPDGLDEWRALGESDSSIPSASGSPTASPLTGS
jgi:hypothetical protein